MIAFKDHSTDHPWRIEVERDAGTGRLDLIVWRPNDHRAVIQGYKLTDKGKYEVVGTAKSRQLTKWVYESLDHVQNKYHRNIVASTKNPDVTELHEYGVAFWGKDCAVVGRMLTRNRAGETWTTTKGYGGDQD